MHSIPGQYFSLPKGGIATVDFLQSLADTINGANIGATAKVGFVADMIKRPVTECGAYVLLENLSFGNAEFSVTVYSPLSSEGKGCIEKAQAVCRAISGQRSDLCIENLTMGAVQYNSNSNAFTVKISGTATGVEGSILPIFGGVSARAFNFKSNSDRIVEFTAESVKIECDYSPYPIKTICSGKPLDVLTGEKRYTITFGKISQKTADSLTGNGTFSVEIKSDGEMKYFADCYCEKLVGDKLVIKN